MFGVQRLVRKAHAGHQGLERWLRTILARQLRLPLEEQAKLGLTRTVFDGIRFVTGRPVVFTAKPMKVSRSKYAPAGQFVAVVKKEEEDAVPAMFRRPLVIEHGKRGNSKTNWRMRLFDIFRKKGKRLSQEMYRRWRVDGVILVFRKKPVGAVDLSFALDPEIQAQLETEREEAYDQAVREEARRNLVEAEQRAERAERRLEQAKAYREKVFQRMKDSVTGDDWDAYLDESIRSADGFREEYAGYIRETRQQLEKRFRDVGVPVRLMQEAFETVGSGGNIDPPLLEQLVSYFKVGGERFPYAGFRDLRDFIYEYNHADEITANIQEVQRVTEIIARLEGELKEARSRAEGYGEHAVNEDAVKEASRQEFEELFGERLSKVSIYISNGEEHASEVKAELFGDRDVTEEQVASLSGIAGWPGNNNVFLSYVPGYTNTWGRRIPAQIRVNGTGDFIDAMDRTIFIHEGKLHISNNHLKKDEDKDTPEGTGIRAFYSQVLAARSLGVREMGCSAHRSDPPMTADEWEAELEDLLWRIDEKKEEIEELREKKEEARDVLSERQQELVDMREVLEQLSGHSLPEEVIPTDLERIETNIEIDLEDTEEAIRDLLLPLVADQDTLWPDDPRLGELGPLDFLPAGHPLFEKVSALFEITHERVERLRRMKEASWSDQLEEYIDKANEIFEAEQELEEIRDRKNDAKYELSDLKRDKRNHGKRPPLGYIGYKVWPKFGYNAYLDRVLGEEVIDELIQMDILEPKYSEEDDEEIDYAAYTMHDLHETSDGRDWWEENGFSFDAKFDTFPYENGKEPPHMEVLKRYIEKRVKYSGAADAATFLRMASLLALCKEDVVSRISSAKEPPAISLSESIRRVLAAASGESPVDERGEPMTEEIEITPEDEEILNEVWDELREEWRQRDIEAGIRRP